MQLEKAAGALGAYVTGVSLAEAADSQALFTEVYRALIEHEVLFFRDQALEPTEYQAFARRFGEIEGHRAYPTVPGAPDVQVLESTAEAPSKIEAWHSDMTFRPAPPALTLLHGQIIPEYGGDTMWLSATAAYAALSAELAKFLDGLNAEHDFCQGFRESLAEPGGAERLAGAVAENPPITHPVIRTHPESGRKAIFVNSLFTTRIEGLTPVESDVLLQFLYRHLTTEEHTVRLSWQPGTVAIWDNRATQHKPVNDFFPQHRKMHRITIAGDEPA
ncbi:MAG: TauD/TfdA family dioxygenase [Gammaproteobacteria bacterium]|nr:TauD/TfdA family dioxygenase [Gammaproteobacteria bacterium]